MLDWHTDSREARQEFWDFCCSDRDELLNRYDCLYPQDADKTSAEKVEDVILDVCGFHVVDQPLGLGQLAFCDFMTKTVIVNSETESFVNDGVCLERLRWSTLAHELGHIRLHAEEILEEGSICYYGEGREFVDTRSYQKEREADFYAAVFLVSKEGLLAHPSAQEILEYRLSRRKMASGAIWKHVYRISSSFLVTPTLLKNCLVEFGWVTAMRSRGPSGLQKLELRFVE